MKKKIYLVTKNHPKLSGIYSYISILRNLFKNYEIVLSNNLKKNSTNIIIENFKKKEFQDIIAFKKKYNCKVIFILTEFFNDKAKTFNCFELKNSILKYVPFQLYNNTILIALISTLYTLTVTLYYELKLTNFIYLIVFLSYIYLPHVYVFLRRTIKIIILKFFIIKSIKVFGITNIVKDKRLSRKIFLVIYFFFDLIIIYNRSILDFVTRNTFLYYLNKFRYFKARYLYAEKFLEHSDVILASHPEIYKHFSKKNKNVFLISPYIKNVKFNKKNSGLNYYKFSGVLSKYRKSLFLRKLKIIKNHLFAHKKLHKIKIFLIKISKYKNDSFIDISNSKKYKYSFHPKKDKDWIYSSPIRYISAINNGEIPLILDKFNDIFSRNLAIKINLNKIKEFLNLENFYLSNINILKKGIKKYNKFAQENNKRILKKVSVL